MADRKNQTRRDILKLSAAGAAGMAAPLSFGAAQAQELKEEKPLQGQVALVTGAARGIGRAIAQTYARAGAHVALLDIADPDAFAGTVGFKLASQADLDEAAGLVEAEGVEALKIKADVRDYEAVAAAVKATLDAFGRIDIAVANAGISAGGAIGELSPERFQVVSEVNITGVYNTLRAATAPMVEQKIGCMITIASVLGRQGSQGNSNYAASKWAVIGLTKSVALDLGKSNITVNAIAPTGVRTGFWAGALASEGGPERVDQYLKQRHALDVGILEPQEIADAALFLASDGAKRISGSCIDVSGGTAARYTA
jgi:NAD(P)-dependent dehydrogenase (short-subunit alcohol dehydrogenase family)